MVLNYVLNALFPLDREAIIEQAEKKKKEKQDWRDLARRLTANTLVLIRKQPGLSFQP
jgi:hypothetical protein